MSEARHVETILEGVLQPNADEPVARIPFYVPEGSTRVTLAYEHDAGHVLDLGLQDVAGEPFPSLEGFRGWSGGARRHVFVARDDATPGYLPGAIPSGTWHVLLGRADVQPPGCTYRVHVVVDVQHPTATKAPVVTDAPKVDTFARGEYASATDAAIDAPWFPGDLQTHTHHSDAKGSLDELLTAAERRGLAYLAVTDHNTVSHHAPLARHEATSLLAVPGMEVTTYLGHANVWGAAGWVDFRLASDADVAWMIDQAHALGGVVSINHPKTQPGCIGCDWEFAIPDGIDAMEVWQGPWWLRNWESLARYDALLARGDRLTLVGGSDRHQPAGEERDPDELRVGSPTTWLQVDALTIPGVLAALRTGRASVSATPNGPRLEVTAGSTPTGGTLPAGTWHDVEARVAGAAGERLRWLGVNGVERDVAIDADDFTDRYVWPADGPYLRCEVTAEGSLAARRAALEQATRTHALPFGLTLEEIHAHPWRLALANPIYAA